jgi:protein-disulfide isomerase
VNRKWLVFGTVAVVVAAFGIGVSLFKEKTNQEVVKAAQTSNDSLIRPHSPVFGNPNAKVTIVEFFDPSCESCRAFYPTVKSIVNASFGQVRLVLRYAALHKGSDEAVKILEAVRLQGKYWPAVEKALADQPRWASHGNPQPALIWESFADLGIDIAKAKADMNSPAIAQVLQQDMADLQTLKVKGTPSFFVNGTPLTDFGAPQLKALVDQEIAKAKTP